MLKQMLKNRAVKQRNQLKREIDDLREHENRIKEQMAAKDATIGTLEKDSQFAGVADIEKKSLQSLTLTLCHYVKVRTGLELKLIKTY
jgi:hypothetical protein